MVGEVESSLHHWLNLTLVVGGVLVCSECSLRCSAACVRASNRRQCEPLTFEHGDCDRRRCGRRSLKTPSCTIALAPAIRLNYSTNSLI